jgi:hypothetical protein
MMRPSPTVVSALPTQRARVAGPRRKEDLVYQAVTVAAMVTLLASVWVF